MKTIINKIVIGFVAAISLVSCSIAPSVDKINDKVIVKEIAFTAYLDPDATKSTLGEGGAVLWSPRDSICVSYGYLNSGLPIFKCISDNTNPASSVKFYGNLPAEPSGSQDDYYYAFYPYDESVGFWYGFYYTFPSVQFAKKGSFGERAFPSAARSKDTYLFFYNICGGIKLTVTKPGITKISLKSNGGERISGQGHIGFDDNGRPRFECIYDQGNDFVELIAPGGGFEVGAPYYLILPPITFSKGFTITFLTDSEKAVRNIEKSVTIERSVFSKLTDADKSLTYSKLQSAADMLVGQSGIKYWLWDCWTEYSDIAYGQGTNNGNGYPADQGVIPGFRGWGNTPEDLASGESRFAYMSMDSDNNCIAYSEDGKEVRRGKFNISEFSPTTRADGWSLGKFTTDSPSILFPKTYFSEEVTDFDILQLTSDKMILGKNDTNTSVGNGGTYVWWRFRSVDKATFEKGKPTKISLDKSSVEIYQGDEITLTATITPEDGSFWGVKWSFDNYNVLSSYGSGKFGAYGEDGIARITATTAGGVTAECEVLVKQRIPVESFTLSTNHIELIPGESTTISATVLPETATLRNVEWKTSDSEIATIDESGKVTAISHGWATIYATTDGGRQSQYCNVFVRNNSVEGISLDKYWIELFPDQKDTIKATIYPEWAANKNMTWSSFDTNIATVDNNGIVTAVSPGWTQVRVTSEDGNCENYCGVYVKEMPVTGVTLDKQSEELFVGDRLLLVATIIPSNATNQAVTWRSSKTDVVTVDQKGLVKAVGSGNATVTVKTKDGNFEASCSFTVRSNGVEPNIGDWENGENHSGNAY